ncbi:MAG: MscS mechanosensitive ion channel [uncultured bacterium]|nr:MAG: MscS mechanosensitive ion channel [uncultured bacterium]
MINKRGNLLIRTTMRAAKLPILYFIFGTVLIASSYIDNIFPITQWKNLFDLTDKIGSIFITLAFITFAYKFTVISVRLIEKSLLLKNKKVASLILSSLRKGLRIIFILIAINIIITIIAPTEFYLTLANNIIKTIIIIAIGWIAIQILYTIEAVLYEYASTIESQNQLRAKALYTKTHIIRNITTVLIVFITIAALLMSFSSVRNIGISLLASAGFLTAIIGLSAQKTLFSVFSGLQIALSQVIKIGDMVVIENESGIIEEVTFTYVTLKLGDRRRMIVPINYFIEKPFENWSHDGDSIRSSFVFHVDHLMPIEPLRTEINRIIENSIFWDGVAKKIHVNELTKDSVEIRVQVSAINADNLADLRIEVREKILEFMQKNYAEYFPKIYFSH